MNTDKYFNELISRIENPLEFNILVTLSELVDNLTIDEKNELDDKLKTIGVSKGYFNIINDGTGWYALSELGIELKESNKLHKEFEKKRKSKPFDKKYIGFGLTAIVIILSVVWRCEDKKEVVPVDNQSYHPTETSSEKPYNKTVEKEQTLLDTSKTKTASDQKND